MGDLKFCFKCMEQYDVDQHICPHCGFDETTPHNANYIVPGTVLRDRYLIGTLIEYNGEGATYIGHDLSTECKVLVREYMPVNFCTRVKNKPTISVNYNNLAKYKSFMAEYTELNKSLARLRNNSNIDPILDMFADNNTTYTVFEYIEGEKMLRYLKDNAGELSWEQVSKLFPPLFTTVGILHNTGIIHRAISPETIYINSRGELKLSGFCVSAVRTADAGLEYELFKGYAAPEQYSADSSSRQGTWTDVYGLCALLYRSLTGCMPVDSVSRLKNDDLCEPSVLNPSIPHHVSKVIMEGMALSSSDRIQTITELVTRLFEQPVVPVKPAAPSNAPSQDEPMPQPVYDPQPPPGYYDDRGYYPPPPPMQPRRRRAQEVEEEEENMVDKLKVPVIIGVLLLAILLIILVFLWPVISSGKNNDSSSSSSSSSSDAETSDGSDNEPKPDTDVPNFVGNFFSITEEKYKEYFKFEAEYVFDNTHEADIILEQDIEAGKQVKQGSTIKLVVSKGNEGADIPAFEGMTVSQYENELKKVGITNYKLVKSGNNQSVVPDTVVQLQLDGRIVEPGTYFSNKEGNQLVVYYIPADVEVAPQVTQTPQVQQTTPVTTEAAPATTAVQTTPATEAPPQETPPVDVPEPPAEQPEDPNPGEYGYEGEFGFW